MNHNSYVGWPGMEPDLHNKRWVTEAMVTIQSKRPQCAELHAEAEETIDLQAYNTS
jgi:hypothetical protein